MPNNTTTDTWERDMDNAFWFRDSGTYIKCYPELNLQQLACLRIWFKQQISLAEQRGAERVINYIPDVLEVDAGVYEPIMQFKQELKTEFLTNN